MIIVAYADNPANSRVHLLSESRKVLDNQIQIVEHQQTQATKIIRVLLTITGLFLTAASITLTLFSSGLIGSNLNIVTLIQSLTATSAIYGIIGVFLLTLFSGVFVLMFIFAFNVMSPKASGSGAVSLVNSLLETRVIGTFFEIYVRPIEFYYDFFFPGELSIKDVLSQQQEDITLRPGIDGKEAKSLAKSEGNVLPQILNYNAGCIEKNEDIIARNRRQLSAIYTTAVLSTTIFFVIVIFGGIGLLFLQ